MKFSVIFFKKWGQKDRGFALVDDLGFDYQKTATSFDMTFVYHLMWTHEFINMNITYNTIKQFIQI